MNHSTSASTRAPFDPSLYITVFADASYCPTTQAYGWCWWIKHGKPAKTELGVGGGSQMRGSNQAEIEALRAALAFVAKSLPAQLQGKRIVIQSDCTGALEAIRPEMNALRRQGAAMVYTKHVKGHRGHETARNSVNTLCDRKAKEQMKIWRAKAEESSSPVRAHAPRP